MNEEKFYEWIMKSGEYNGKDKPAVYPFFDTDSTLYLNGRFTLCQLETIVELMKYAKEENE